MGFLCSPHVSVGYLWLLPRSKDMHVVRLIGVSNLAMDVNVSGNGYLSLCVSLVIDW